MTYHQGPAGVGKSFLLRYVVKELVRRGRKVYVTATSGRQTEVWGLKTEVWGLGTEAWGLKTEVWGLKTEVWGLKTEVWGLKTEVWGLKTEVWGLETGAGGMKAGDACRAGCLVACIAYCLPAGIAAVNLELDDNMSGSTIHSFAGIGHGQDNVSFILDRISRGKREHTVGQGPTFGVRVQQLLWTVLNGCCCMQAAYRWRHCHVLIIDEISMLSADLFSKLDQLGRHMRNRVNEPFGGIQVPAYLLQALYACLLCPWWADPSLP